LAAGLAALGQIELENDIEIPIDALNHIDEGLNPEAFSKNMVDKCAVESEGVRGKVAALAVTLTPLHRTARTLCCCAIEWIQSLTLFAAGISTRLTQRGRGKDPGGTREIRKSICSDTARSPTQYVKQ